MEWKEKHKHHSYHADLCRGDGTYWDILGNMSDFQTVMTGFESNVFFFSVLPLD